MTEKEIKDIFKHYMKGSLYINGLFAMKFEVDNIIDGKIPVKHFNYSNSCLDLVI